MESDTKYNGGGGGGGGGAEEPRAAGGEAKPSRYEEVMSKPITGPAPAGPAYIFEPDYDRPMSPALYVGRFFADLIRKPAIWIRENVVEPNRGPKYYWYHRKYARALPVDECYLDDLVCIQEAEYDYKRTYMVDRATLDLLRQRRDNCYYWHQTNIGKKFPSEACSGIADTFREEELNFFIKYGELHFRASVLHAYNKQKHRMIIERRRAIKEQQGDLAEEKPN